MRLARLCYSGSPLLLFLFAFAVWTVAMLYGMMGASGGESANETQPVHFLLASTVMVGALTGVMTSLLGLWMHLSWYAGLVSGAFFSTTSLMRFWAYLMLNFVARVTLPRRVWRWAQAVFLLMAIYDMLWWRYHLNVTMHATHAMFSTYCYQGFWPLVAAIIGAYLKRRMSGSASFLPALFFIYVFTVIDSLPFIWLQYGLGAVGAAGEPDSHCDDGVQLVNHVNLWETSDSNEPNAGENGQQTVDVTACWLPGVY